ncbi:FMN-binding negative transcriptional regulator [Pseudomonas sp. P1B16]|nr:FMN-binding negative transcriptional regulator [Pseudomonas sp. P1B16]WPM28304.1 FMN-binding negative transcriptional regulator [Pseudomonas sp. P1B16]
MVVHAKGCIKLIHDEAQVRKLVAKLTKRHEATMEKPWKISDAPKEYISELLKRIFLIEIEITDLFGKFKLNQDDGPKDMVGAGTALMEHGEQTIGEAMLEAAKKL